MANCNNKCKHSHQDHSLLYVMVFFILLGSCNDPDLSRSTVRNIVAQECASPHEVKREIRRELKRQQ